MNVFDIIGPVMIGPSSSHTAGAVRLGRVANKVMDGRKPVKATITLSGSFAKTYKGHGTDRALLAGIMGFHSWDSEIRDALEIASQRGLDYSFICTDIPGAHPNTARIHFVTEDGMEGEVEGASVGGGNIRVDYVNGMRVDFNGDSNTILVLHNDRPGVIASVTNLLRENFADINICSFRLSRRERGGEAIMTIEIDGQLSREDGEQLISQMRDLTNVRTALLIRKI